MDNETLRQRDLDVVWHPCTQMKDHEQLPMIPIKSGKGVWLHDFDGNRYIDAISSWWVNLFGHSHPKISEAISLQSRCLEQLILAGFTHEPIIRLSEQLIELAPSGLTRSFYADNGSAAVEIAMKMSFHYWLNQGKTKKTRFISLTNSYHGETLGALSVGDVALYKKTYEPLLLNTIHVQSPDCYYKNDDETCHDYCKRLFEPMRKTLETHANETCAVIVEPLIQCAGSMRMYDPIYLTLLRQACDEFDVHLIADEIAVGFGRTGTLFACEQANITPDFLCLGKGLTGGYLPMSACLTNDKIYNAFYDDYTSLKAFLHSHSYTGNPLACAAALATLALFETDNVIENNKTLSRYMHNACDHLNSHPHIADVRQTGMVVAIEMVEDKKTKKPYRWQQRRGLKVYEHGLKNEALLRPLGDVIYLMPPYVITESEIDHLVKVIDDGITIATR